VLLINYERGGHAITIMNEQACEQSLQSLQDNYSGKTVDITLSRFVKGHGILRVKLFLI
jgi:hypothetical protein